MFSPIILVTNWNSKYFSYLIPSSPTFSLSVSFMRTGIFLSAVSFSTWHKVGTLIIFDKNVQDQFCRLKTLPMLFFFNFCFYIHCCWDFGSLKFYCFYCLTANIYCLVSFFSSLSPSLPLLSFPSCSFQSPCPHTYDWHPLQLSK